MRISLALATALALSLCGCHSTLDAQLDAGVPDDGVEQPDFAGLDLFGVDLTPCTPKVTSCSGLCGPIFDSCLGKDVQCGGCSATDAGVEVCNLVTHQCEVPKVTCAALGAQCGTIKNSCGTRLACPSCPTSQECDPDTNTCVACQNVTCQQLGYECGRAWLGCGPTTNTTDCGACPAGAKPVCNPFFNVCEPNCTPQPAATICAAAKTARGVECGIISDGCGGYVDCGGCQAGFACGAQGDPNRCEPKEEPTECVAAGVECGTIPSACGGSVNCGSCTPPAVCNANGKCGMPCTPKTCAELGNPQCGLVDDGCGGTKKCGDCPDPVAYTCLANHTCCQKKTCAVDYAGKCGTGLDDGCGGTLNCGCASGNCTAMASGMSGTCCVNTAKCAANACNTSVTDTCTGATINCACDALHYCDTTSNTCQLKSTCATYGASGGNGQPCSNAGAFNDGTGKLLACPCTGGRFCITGAAPSPVATGSQMGMCCTDTGACNQGAGMVSCNVTHTNSCTGGNDVCGNCPGGQFCNGSNLCQQNFNCATYGANGQAGQICSNGASPSFPNGAGTDLTCACKNGGQCISGTAPNGTVVSGGTTGLCCVNTAKCVANTCNTSVTDTCTGATINCTCDAAHYCSGTTCVLKQTCASLGKTGAVGSGCNDNKFYDDGSGNKIACPCNPGGGLTNIQCAGESTTVEGTCQCTASTCSDCSQNGQANGCGGTKSCACAGAANVCYPPAGGPNGCCQPKTCSALPGGVPAGACGAFSDGCGSSFSCGCPSVNPITSQPMPNEMCVPVGGSSPAYGTCSCTPTPCTMLGAGHHVNDGCGNPIDCGA
jgi:hypothetical protein